jgi:eukaryotic-like serine/threonine-protein kinase
LPRFAELEAEYEILRELGRGGTAVVYLAREREIGREVAIKVVRATYVEDDEAAARLVREARTVAGLRHPNIVMLHGTRRLADGSLALIMQYIHGRTLKQEIRERGAAPLPGRGAHPGGPGQRAGPRAAPPHPAPRHQA